MNHFSPLSQAELPLAEQQPKLRGLEADSAAWQDRWCVCDTRVPRDLRLAPFPIDMPSNINLVPVGAFILVLKFSQNFSTEPCSTSSA
jgi:hypothetical protein